MAAFVWAPIAWRLLAVLCVLGPCALSQAGVTVGLYFVEGQDEPIDFLTIPPLAPFDFIQPWQMTGPGTQFVTDGAFAGQTEQDVRRAIISEVRSRFYSVPTPAGYMLDIDFLPQTVSGPGTVNVLLGKHNIASEQWFGYAMVGGALGVINGECNAAVSIDRIASLLQVDFIEFGYAVNAVANVTAHEVGHLFGLQHVWADSSAPGWKPGYAVAANPYDVMSTGPTGLPDSGWIEDNIFTTVSGTQAVGASSASLMVNQIGLRLAGDTDFDGDVDNADIGKVIGAFTGASGAGRLYADGDMDFDGDVDNADLGFVAGAFTGTLSAGSTADDDGGGAADLIYDPATGDVRLDASEASGGMITSFQIETGAGTFIPGNYIRPAGGFGRTTEQVETGVMGDGDWTFAGFCGAHDFGEIFPAGMDLEQLQAYLTTAVYTGALGSGQQPLNLVVVPEPGTLVLVGLGGLAPVLGHKRRQPLRRHGGSGAGNASGTGTVVLFPGSHSGCLW